MLKRSQPAGFELALQPDATKAAEALNVRTARPPPGARDIGVLVAPRPQPEARLWAPGGEPDDWPPVLTAPGQGEGATPRRPDERERERERSLSSVRFGSDGVMRVVQ